MRGFIRPLEPQRRPIRSRGFTLVELMAALTGGLIFSIAVFALSRDTTRFYQREARVADATLATVVGFERLRADIARAGFMVSPNINADPMFCRQPGAVAGWPGIMGAMTSIRLADQVTSSDTDFIYTSLGQRPDQIILAGNYTSTDDYDFVTVDNCSTTPIITLRENTGGLARNGYAASAQRGELLQQLFPPGRVLRIVDDGGWQQYGVIEDTSTVHPVTDEDLPTITLATEPRLRCGGTAAMVCGLTGRSSGKVNVVNFIRYSIRNVRGEASFAPLFATDAATAPGEATRTELVRDELDPLQDTDTPIADSTELVAEYAVDLNFGCILPTGAASTNLSTDPDPTSFSTNPQRVRAIRARLSIRSRDADRATDVPLGFSRNGIYRIGLGDNGTAPFARVRTMQADIMLHNQSGVEW